MTFFEWWMEREGIIGGVTKFGIADAAWDAATAAERDRICNLIPAVPIPWRTGDEEGSKFLFDAAMDHARRILAAVRGTT